MPALSEHARFILDRMERDRPYEVLDLRAFIPEASVESLRSVMHELWLNRQVERAGQSGWRRHRSSSGHETSAPGSGGRHVKAVKPEDLFDHDTFEDFFR